MRPVAFDLETTGLDLWHDRIVQISLHDLTDDIRFTSLVNPGIPITEEAQAVHGISDERVRSAPTWTLVAPQVNRILDVPDLCLVTYNGARFDTPFLWAEYQAHRMDPPFDIETVRELDVYRLWNRAEPRTLSGAVRRWLGEDLEGAHDAQADVDGTTRVLGAITGRLGLKAEDHTEVLGASRFGIVDDAGNWLTSRHRGERAADTPGYRSWMLRQEWLDPVSRAVLLREV